MNEIKFIEITTKAGVTFLISGFGIKILTKTPSKTFFSKTFCNPKSKMYI